MKHVFINNDNLTKEQIDEEVIRVKAIMINSNNELLLGYSHNAYQFPGGHLEFNETLNDCLEREIKEETGIKLSLKELEPFFLIKYYTKNYLNTKKNRCNKIYYFIVRTDMPINLKETDYTKEELDGNYVLRYVSLDDVEEILIDNSNVYPKHKGITFEMLEAINEYNNMER